MHEDGVSEPVPDRGAQAERTCLAWDRTAAALAVAAAVVGRLTAPRLGEVALLVTAAGLLTCLGLLATGRRRGLHGARALRERAPLAGGTAVLAAAAVAVLLAGTELAHLAVAL